MEELAAMGGDPIDPNAIIDTSMDYMTDPTGMYDDPNMDYMSGGMDYMSGPKSLPGYGYPFVYPASENGVMD
jgi:hypothetical protein